MPAQQPIDRFTYSRNGVGNRDERCMIRVNIPGVTTDTPHTLYKIDVTNLQSNQTWQTSHRYSEFLALRNELTAQFAKAERKCPGCLSFEKVIKLFEFPSKHLFTSKNPMVVNYRKKALKAFLALLASHTFTSAPKCPTCSGSVFTAVRDFLTEDPDAGARAESISSSGSGGERDTIDSVQIKNRDTQVKNRDTIRESIQVKNFTTYVPVPKMKPVNSEGAFIRDEDRRKGSSSSSRSGGGGTATKAAGAATQKNTSTTSGGGGSARKLQQKPAAKMVDLPSPLSSTMSSTSSTSSPPASPHKLAENGNAESFVSFSGEAAMAHPTNAGSTPRRGSSKRNKNKTAKKSSQSAQLQAQASVKESMDDDEFGSLNMDFMTSMSVAKN